MLQRYAPGFVATTAVAYALSIAVSLARRLRLPRVGLLAAHERDRDVRDVLPGAMVATVVLEATFQVLPSTCALEDVSPRCRRFGGPAILLVWLYVMANVIVFGAELNWWGAGAAKRRHCVARRRHRRDRI